MQNYAFFSLEAKNYAKKLARKEMKNRMRTYQCFLLMRKNGFLCFALKQKT
jgi:hypothetical protein